MKIAVIDSGYRSYAFEKELFEKNGFSLDIYPEFKGERSVKKKFAKDAIGILVRHTKIDEEFLEGLSNLRAIVRYGVGYDNLDIETCTKYGIKAANVQGYANDAVSDHAIALMFSCARGMWNTHLQVTQQFAAPPVPDIFELHDKTLGVIGIGRIGSKFCVKVSPLVKKVIAADPYKPDSHFEQLGVRRVDLHELLTTSNVISLHCNLTEETTHLLNSDAFSIMHKKPVIINTSRGPVIDGNALVSALESGMVHSAGLDVFEDEPLTDKQTVLVNHPRIICTGHYAWYSDRAALELQKRAAYNMVNLLTGNHVDDCLNCSK